MDFQDFFRSIGRDKIFTVFRTFGYNSSISYALTNLCTYNGSLPQGAVTSPALSNIVCMRLDRRLVGFTSRRNIAYTRYSDDLAFSATNPSRLNGLVAWVERIARTEGFLINDGKTRYMDPGTQCRLTGIVLGKDRRGNDIYGVGRGKERQLRTIIHALLKTHPTDASYEAELSRLKGWFSFLMDIDS
jgi:hypothetical protein